MIRAFAPGRVNLIGDHTDYLGGYALPIAIDLGTTVAMEPGGDALELVSDSDPAPARVPVDVRPDGDALAAIEPAWARYVAAVVSLVRPAIGGVGKVSTTLPVGAGLSSSASLEVALALSLGFGGTATDLARLCQQAEHLATGTATGIMDQLASAAAVAGHAMLIDCRSLALRPVALPSDAAVVIVDSGQRRSVGASAYQQRRDECEAAQQVIGPLRDASAAEVSRLDDSLLRRRARHVVTENARVLAMAEALAGGDLRAAGRLMVESHASLRDDFEVSTPVLDRLVEDVLALPGVHGARMTGAGFGGFVVALVDAGAAEAAASHRSVSGRLVASSGPANCW